MFEVHYEPEKEREVGLVLKKQNKTGIEEAQIQENRRSSGAAKRQPHRKQIRKMMLKGNTVLFSVSVVCSLLNAVLNVFIAYLFQIIMDAATGHSMDELTQAISFCGIYFVIYIANNLLMRETKNRFIQKALRQYKEYAFRKMMKKSISSFANESTSTYISGLSNDINSIEENLLQSALDMVVYMATFAAAVGMMFWYSWFLTLVAIVFSVLPMIVSFIIGNKLVVLEKSVSEGNKSFVGMVKDMLNGFSVVKSFKAESEVTAIFTKSNSELEREKCQKRKRLDLIQLISGASGALVQVAVFLCGSYLAIEGTITAGVVVAFVQLMNYILTPISIIPTLMAKCFAAFGLMDKLADELEDNRELMGEIEKRELQQAIVCKDLSFAYEEGKQILKNVSLQFECGKSYAIVGASGSGKSTLLNLLLGSYTTYDGEILFDGVELKEISSNSLYDLLSIIQQNVFIFDSTVRENITMFKQFEDTQIEQAIEKSGLRAFMEEKGDMYRCGENGVGLSGGERQRISIARSLLRKTPVLLMDEATASLDNATSYLVEDAILKIEEMIRIVITHKLQETMLRRYDQIIVLNEGSVIETGSFSELMEKRGYFYALFQINQSTDAEQKDEKRKECSLTEDLNVRCR